MSRNRVLAACYLLNSQRSSFLLCSDSSSRSVLLPTINRCRLCSISTISLPALVSSCSRFASFALSMLSFCSLASSFQLATTNLFNKLATSKIRLSCSETNKFAIVRAILRVLLQSLSCPLKVLILSGPNNLIFYRDIQNILSSLKCFIQRSTCD